MRWESTVEGKAMTPQSIVRNLGLVHTDSDPRETKGFCTNGGY